MYAHPRMSGATIECTKNLVITLLGENNNNNQKGMTPQFEKGIYFLTSDILESYLSFNNIVY